MRRLTSSKPMWYVYALESQKNGSIYIGTTGDLKRRLRDHNSKNGGQYTKRNAPFKLIFYEAFLDKHDAAKDELFFKTGYGREVLRGKLENYLKNR